MRQRTGPHGETPQGFTPSSTSWTSPDHGWVVGFAPSATGRFPVLLRTVDGGASWSPTGAPDLRPPADNKRVRVHVANDRDGLVTDGSGLYATHTAGEEWQPVALPGAGTKVGIGRLASNEHSFYAVVTSDSDTKVFTAPLPDTRWHPVAGVEVPDRGAGDIVAHGDNVYVALGAVHRSHGYWFNHGDSWHEAASPWSRHAAPELGLVPGRAVYLLSGHDPGAGHMRKDLEVSEAGERFTLVSSAPDAGLVTGFAAATPTTVAVTAIGGLAFLYRGVRTGADWRWDTPLTLPEAPMFDLDFTDERHGVLIQGGLQWQAADIYQTRDGAATWTHVPLGNR